MTEPSSDPTLEFTMERFERNGYFRALAELKMVAAAEIDRLERKSIETESQHQNEVVK